MEPEADITILATADWGDTNWTNKQYAALQLARRYAVNYIESLGLRRPTIRHADLMRMLGRLRRTLRSGDTKYHPDAPENIRIWSPVVLPLHNMSFAQSANRYMIRRLDNRLRSRQVAERRILWTFTPFTYGLEYTHDFTIYHSVDLVHEFPGVHASSYLEAERRMLRRVDRIVASSVAVARHLHRLGQDDVILWENVADTESIEATANRSTSGNGRAVFVGNITSAKIDFGVVAAAAACQAVEGIDLYGPVPAWDTDARRFVEKLPPRVRYLGVLKRHDLGWRLSEYSAGLIPYVSNNYTRGVYPMKVNEYLAAGLAMVMTGVECVEDTLDTRRTDRSRIATDLEGAVKDRTAGAGRRLTIARERSWTGRGRQMRALVAELTAGADGRSGAV